MLPFHVAGIHVSFHVFQFCCAFLVVWHYGFSFVFPHSTLQNCHENSATQAQNVLTCFHITGNNQRDDNVLLARHKFSSAGVLYSVLWGHKHGIFIGTFQTNSISNDRFAK